MADAFLSEISLFGFNFAPPDWAACDGQIIPVSQNPALFALLGVEFGGNGTSTFGLPQLQGRVPVSSGTFVHGNPAVYTRGMTGGSKDVTLSVANLPAHRHDFYASDSTADFGANFPSEMQLAVNDTGYTPSYTDPTSLMPLNAAAVTSSGSGQSHTNIQPYQVVLFCICTDGVFPPRN